MNFPWSEIFAGAALLLAVFSPVITACINARTQKVARESTFYLHHRAEVIENYVRYTGAYIRFNDTVNENYGAAYGEILLYVSGELSEKIIALNDLLSPYITAENQEKALVMFNEICFLLSHESPRQKKKWRSKHKENQ